MAGEDTGIYDELKDRFSESQAGRIVWCLQPLTSVSPVGLLES